MQWNQGQENLTIDCQEESTQYQFRSRWSHAAALILITLANSLLANELVKEV